MKPRLSTIAVSVVLSALVASCGSESGPMPAGNAGPQPGGSGGMNMIGMVSAGSGTGGSDRPIGGASGAGSAAAGTTAAGSSAMGDVPATFETVKLVLGGGGGIMPCSAAPCHGVHGMAPPQRPLELPPTDDAKLYANLTSYVSKACGEIKLVTPGNAQQSALVRILSGPCGTTPRMPYGCSADAGDCIPDEYIAAVSQWIANGASPP